ncbi:hypothetical protein [Anaerotruncus rubiinfantis]|uniref:hypothetical protein n=1 Tax=Anaerotruncus rubiinfantis TaxID=1720200 RepID=UPI000A504B66|nr:hypothetical protein [Anaerotruncus rubiinfantis]
MGGTLSLIGIMMLIKLDFYPMLAIAVLYIFLSIRFEDRNILDFLKSAFRYFLLVQQKYEWAIPEPVHIGKGVNIDQRHKQKRKKAKGKTAR